MRKFLVMAVILLCSLPAFAQSDCNFAYCGSVPLMGVEESEAWRTDLFLSIEATGPFYFRLRTAPEHLEHYVELLGPGTYVVGVYDVISRAWPGVTDFSGVVLFDYASESPVNKVELLAMARTTDAGCGKGNRLPVFVLEPGCHRIPRPWHGGHLAAAFQFFNYDEHNYQTVTVNDSDLLVALPSPVHGETVLEVAGPANGAYVTVCLGEPPPGSQATFDPELPLWFIPRFQQFDDFVVSTVW